MERLIIFTGKGGVGKTSIAAAHAWRSAAEGKRTLLVSTDMAHNLGDLFEVTTGGQTVQAAPDLDLLELDPFLLMHTDFPNVNRAIANLLGTPVATGGADEFSTMLPGFENLFCLLKIEQLAKTGDYDRIMVDCAPTGETLSLLKLPELLAWYMEKFFPVGKAMVRILSPVSKHKYQMTLPDRKAMNEIEQMYDRLLDLQLFLKNADTCSVRLVSTPERMAVEETKRSFMYLNLYGYTVDGLFINRILSEDPGNDFMRNWQAIQKPYIAELEAVFTQVPVYYVPWYQQEILGTEAVQTLSGHVLNDAQTFAVRAEAAPEYYDKTEDGYCLNISLPASLKKEPAVRFAYPDLYLKFDNFNRCIPLPETLQTAELKSCEAEADQLKIYFKLPPPKEADEKNRIPKEERENLSGSGLSALQKIKAAKKKQAGKTN